TGLASDAQTVDGARSALAQAEAALRVLQAGGTPEGPAAGPSPEELQVEVDRARLAVETARASLTGTTVVAPVAATVTAVDVTVGTAVGEGAVTPASTGAGDGSAPAAGTITLTATQALVAEITVPETDAVLLEDGMPAELKFSAIPDVVGTGQVLTVLASEPGQGGAEGGVDPFTGQPLPAQKTYTVTVAVDELPAGARGGLSVAARITTGDAPDALVVPTAAVQQSDGATTVQVVDGETVEDVEVELGLRQGGYSQVLDGLEEGDVVRVADPMAGGGEEFLGAP
ncbi:efflux RND transporter periplasmic adaptor subunit, partial [Aquipuribacter hungaricus]